MLVVAWASFAERRNFCRIIRVTVQLGKTVDLNVPLQHKRKLGHLLHCSTRTTNLQRRVEFVVARS